MNFARLGQALYEGTVSIDFVGRRRAWYAVSAVLIAVSLFGLFGVKLNWGIEFEGGVEYRVSVAQPTQDQVDEIQTAVQETGLEAASAPIVNTSGQDAIRVQTKPLSNDDARVVAAAIQETTGVSSDDLSQNVIGPSWGQQVAEKAQLGLVVFLVLVLLLIWGYFREWKMSVAAMVALFHDVVITVGVYALSGFEVTPTTVTGVLTILAFSLYDTIVVFDKVRENTANLRKSHRTYAESANLAVNQNLVRSINTTIIALLPLGAVLYAGVVMVGTGALKDLALSLFVGTAVGIYSSVFIATPLLVQLKNLDPAIRSGNDQAMRHRSRRVVDPYADVPAYAVDMPVQDAPGAMPADLDDDVPDQGGAPARAGNRPGPAGAPGRYTAGERDTSRRPVPMSDRTSSGRPQPTRKPRSRRGKK
jgi:preprotein translocase subunit SecF